jgi:hypothetical protein
MWLGGEGGDLPAAAGAVNPRRAIARPAVSGLQSLWAGCISARACELRRGPVPPAARLQPEPSRHHPASEFVPSNGLPRGMSSGAVDTGRKPPPRLGGGCPMCLPEFSAPRARQPPQGASLARRPGHYLPSRRRCESSRVLTAIAEIGTTSGGVCTAPPMR